MTTVQSLALSLYSAFESATRNDGATFYKLKDGSPEWMSDVIMAAHGNMLPDDWRYAAIRDMAIEISDMEDAEDSDAIQEACDRNVSVYTAHLTAWLASDIARVEYCETAREELSAGPGIVALMSNGQYLEYQEILEVMLSELSGLAESEEA